MVCVIQNVVQGLWSTWEHSLSRFQSWGNCGNHHKLLKWFSLKFTKYLFPLVKKLPIFEYKWVNVNSYSIISCLDRILRNLSEFFRKVWIPLKFEEEFKVEFVPKFVTWILLGIGSGANEKRCSPFLNLSLCKISKKSISGKQQIWI
jgi:hypothetical protein